MRTISISQETYERVLALRRDIEEYYFGSASDMARLSVGHDAFIESLLVVGIEDGENGLELLRRDEGGL